MANELRDQALAELLTRFGTVRKLGGSQSMFIVGDDAARVYFRYSKLHPNRRQSTFYGLRQQDLYCSFLDYANVYNSYNRLSGESQ